MTNTLSRLRPALLVISVLCTLCTASPASALEQVTLQLKWMHQFQFAGYYAAVQQGYYRDAGLNVTISQATTGIDPVQEVINGKADYGVGSSSLLLMRNAGKPVVTLAVIFQHSPYIILTKEYSASQTIHNLVNKRLMLEPQADELVAYLTKEGIPMQRLEHSFNLKDLIDGKVDAVSGYITTDPDDLNRVGFAYHAYSPRSAGIDFYGDNLFTTENELKNHPTRAKAFREASLKGWRYALDHPDEIIDLILSRYTPPGIRADRAHLKYEAEQIRQLIQPNLVEIGYMHAGRWRHIADTYNELGMLPKNIDLKKFMYDPHPQKNLTPIYWFASSLLGLALLIIAARLIKTTRNLKKSEAQVREQLNNISEINESLEEQIVQRTAELLDKQKKLEETNFELEVQFEEEQALQEELTETLERLQTNEESHTTIIQTALDGFWLVDVQGRLLEVNESYRKMSGYSEQELLSMTVADLECIESTPKVATRIEKILSIGADFFVTQHRRKDGSTFDVEVSVKYLPIDGGRFVTFMSDITEREQMVESLRESEELFHSLVETSQDLIWRCDVEGRFTYLNLAWEQIFGFELSEMLGRKFSDFQTVENAEREQKELLSLKEDNAIQGYETTCLGRDGNEIHLVINALPLYDRHDKFIGASGTAFDITQRKLMEDELRSSKTAADQANISKSLFLSNMSHEIRTPLNAIIGFSALMLKSILPPNEHDYIQKINSAGETLLNIINNILDFSKIEAGQLAIEETPFMLDTTLANMIHMVQLKATDKGLNLLVRSSPDVVSCLIGDPLRLGQIVVNLLSNAVKFTERGEVILETSLLKQEDGRQQLKFSIRDTGIGIPAEQINKLFEPFTQADESTTRRFGGTGLGLSISKQLVELMGGEIWCESTPGLGSTFSFTAWFSLCQESDLAQCISHCNLSNEDTRQSYDFSTYHILLVEDNEVNQQLALELLKDTGAAMTVASNGAEAVELVTVGSSAFNLVLMDILMPVMDGYEATWLIRSDGRFDTLPIIAMTAHAMLEEQQKILKSGMDAHISKPIDVRTLLRVMRLFLGEPTVDMLSPDAPAKSDSVTAEIPVIAGLDVTGALDRLDGNEKLYCWLLRSFVENKAAAMKIIVEALQSGDTGLAERTAHTLKSSAGTIGAVELESLALRLEYAIEREESAEIVSVALRHLAAEMERVVAVLANTLPLPHQTAIIDSPLARVG